MLFICKSEGIFNLSGIVEVALKIASTFTRNVLATIASKSLSFKLVFKMTVCKVCGGLDHQTGAFECYIRTFVKMECTLNKIWWFNHPKTARKFAMVSKQKGAEGVVRNVDGTASATGPCIFFLCNLTVGGIVLFCPVSIRVFLLCGGA